VLIYLANFRFDVHHLRTILFNHLLFFLGGSVADLVENSDDLEIVLFQRRQGFVGALVLPLVLSEFRALHFNEPEGINELVYYIVEPNQNLLFDFHKIAPDLLLPVLDYFRLVLVL